MSAAVCEACQRFKADRLSGLYIASCRQCQIRDIARGPHHFRSKCIRKITAGYREQLESLGDWQAAHLEVKAWA